MPKTGIEPIFKSYKEFVLPIKLFRLFIFYYYNLINLNYIIIKIIIYKHKLFNNNNYIFCKKY